MTGFKIKKRFPESRGSISGWRTVRKQVQFRVTKAMTSKDIAISHLSKEGVFGILLAWTMSVLCLYLDMIRVGAVSVFLLTQSDLGRF